MRPTYPNILPAELKGVLTADLYKLYKLIWDRFVACQMSAAVYDTRSLDIKAGDYLFKATGSKLKFKGFTALYVEGRDDDAEEKEMQIPLMAVGDKPELKKVDSEQHFTQPPLRYTEATLVKALEEKGIGRPSTYAPTITTIMARGYVAREKKQLYPTELGRVVTDLMLQYFGDVIGIEFTADLEKELDLVESGDAQWEKIITEFYGPFESELKKAEGEIAKIKIADEVSDVVCDKCGRLMVYKMGRFGKFLACPGFPECRNAKPIVKETGVDCPKCGAKVLEKKSKKGKLYFGCEKNPECDFMSWDAPVKGKKCPNCGGLLLKKTGKSKKIYCMNEECGYEEK